MENYDKSKKDNQFLLDYRVFNCPFCNRKSVAYHVDGYKAMNWSGERKAYVYFVKCEESDCEKISMHISHDHIKVVQHDRFALEKGSYFHGFGDEKLDELFFYQHPTKFFLLDSNIPKKIRDSLTEAESCKKINAMVGASANLRKAIYETLEDQGVASKDSENNIVYYKDRVAKLKKINTQIDPELFDAISSVQGMTSEKLHEGEYTPLKPKEFDYFFEVIQDLLHYLYVEPKKRRERKEFLRNLKNE